jgi:hypothetical protein
VESVEIRVHLTVGFCAAHSRCHPNLPGDLADTGSVFTRFSMISLPRFPPRGAQKLCAEQGLWRPRFGNRQIRPSVFSSGGHGSLRLLISGWADAVGCSACSPVDIGVRKRTAIGPSADASIGPEANRLHEERELRRGKAIRAIGRSIADQGSGWPFPRPSLVSPEVQSE